MNKTPEKSPADWPRAVTRLGVTAIIVGGALAGLWIVSSRAERIVDKAVQVPAGVADVLSAVKSGKIQITYRSYASTITGTSCLQVAMLEQFEVFERKDSLQILSIPLPEVVVTASAPVEYVYHLDLEEEWKFEVDEKNKVLVVHAPPIRYNKPAVDPSEIRYETQKNSLLRNDAAVMQQLKAMLTRLCDHRARHNIRLVREVARQKTADFVNTWLKDSYVDGKDYEVKIIFQSRQPDEVQP